MQIANPRVDIFKLKTASVGWGEQCEPQHIRLLLTVAVGVRKTLTPTYGLE